MDNTTTTLQPIPPGEPLPHRKVIRSWTEPLATKVYWRAFVLIAFDFTLFFGLMAAIVMLQAWWAKWLCAVAAGIVIGRLFVIGHDACHMSLTPNRRLNKWLGRIVFLPSLTPYSLWDVGHNVVHHGYTNLKGVDFVWEPLTPAEYAALPLGQKILQRIYRSGWAPGLYYMIEIWWKREFFPSAKYMPTRRPIFIKDSLLSLAFALVWIGSLVGLALYTEQSIALLLLFGFAIPFYAWVSMIGFVIYVHHTHERVKWQNDKAAWAKAAPFVTTTVHLTFPLALGAVAHHIMEHTAHHVDMTVPLYRLKKAQARLEDMMPGRIVVQPFSLGWYFSTARKCKLFCFEKNTWTDFKGRPTAV